MIINAKLTPELLRKEIEHAGSETGEAILKWSSNAWIALVCVASGLEPFGNAAKQAIPKVYHSFLPTFTLSIKPSDRKSAQKSLKHCITEINAAVITTTKETYTKQSGGVEQMINMIKSAFPNGLEDFVQLLSSDLWDYEKRRTYLEAGAVIMPPEQLWTNKHHTLALGVLNICESEPNKVLTDSEFLDLLEDVGILKNNVLQFPARKVA